MSVFFRSNIYAAHYPRVFKCCSIALLNNRKPPTEAKLKALKCGLTYWTLDLSVKQLSDPICLPSRTANASQLLKKCMNRGVSVFQSLQPPHGRLMAASQQPMKHVAWDFYKLQSGQKPWRSIWRRCCARWLRNRAVCFCELQGTAVLQAVPEPSCFPRTPHALCNPPACYEHEVNKTLGHHKSLANDMSGTEIRQPE